MVKIRINFYQFDRIEKKIQKGLFRDLYFLARFKVGSVNDIVKLFDLGNSHIMFVGDIPEVISRLDRIINESGIA